MSFGKLLKKWMFRLEFNQADLSKGTGITVSAISRYINQERKPIAKNVDKIMNFFLEKYGVGEEEFWSLADEGEEVEYATTVKIEECRETSLIEEFYETLKGINKQCDKIVEILEEAKEQK